MFLITRIREILRFTKYEKTEKDVHIGQIMLIVTGSIVVLILSSVLFGLVPEGIIRQVLYVISLVSGGLVTSFSVFGVILVASQ